MRKCFTISVVLISIGFSYGKIGPSAKFLTDPSTSTASIFSFGLHHQIKETSNRLDLQVEPNYSIDTNSIITEIFESLGSSILPFLSSGYLRFLSIRYISGSSDKFFLKGGVGMAVFFVFDASKSEDHHFTVLGNLGIVGFELTKKIHAFIDDVRIARLNPFVIEVQHSF